MSTYRVNNIPGGFKVHIKIFTTLNLIDWDHNCGLKVEIALGKSAKRQCQKLKWEKNWVDDQRNI